MILTGFPAVVALSLRREDWDPAVLSSPCNGCGGDKDESGLINPYLSCLMRNASSVLSVLSLIHVSVQFRCCYEGFINRF